MKCLQGHEMKLVPAGVSKKTGQPYSEFWSCTQFGCKAKPDFSGGSAPAKPQTSDEKPDWDSIAVGKVASNLIVAMVQKEGLQAVKKADISTAFKIAESIVYFQKSSSTGFIANDEIATISQDDEVADSEIPF